VPQQLRIIQNRLANDDTVPAQLPRFADQPSSMGQCTHRDRAVIRCHPAKCRAGDQHSARSQVRGAKSSNRSRRSGADNDNVCHL
jgi:hypothetical protein